MNPGGFKLTEGGDEPLPVLEGDDDLPALEGE
jgi:hypothetical protein